ncbi:MAG: acyl-CoA dehydrogenase family protein, partial [Armatimonadota bacterium]
SEEPWFREEHIIFRDQIRRFVNDEIKPQADKWEETGMVPREVLRKMGENGFLGARYAEQYGGANMDTITTAILAEEFGKSTFGGFAITVLVHTDMASPHLNNAGTPEQLKDYKDLLKDHMVRPTKLEIWLMNADGTGNKQITQLKKASFAPFLHPDGKRIIFCSNWEDPKGREFDLYMIRTDGSHLERITYSGGFDGFPMFTKDGKKLVFSSNRYHGAPSETNIFVADWKD